MNILWIEDFGGGLSTGTDTLASMFKGLLNFDEWDEDKLPLTQKPSVLEEFCQQQNSVHHVYLCRHYFDYLEFKSSHSIINEIDVIITDIRLDNMETESFSLDIPESYTDKSKFHGNGGFYIFNDLIHLGVPAERMCFMSGEKNSFEAFEVKCSEIYIPKVKAFEKSDADYKILREWIEEQGSDYVTLRRGIIEGCNHLKAQAGSFRFNKFIKEPENEKNFPYFTDYAGVLENFLPLQEPKNKAQFYKLFARTLAHEWEDSARPKKLNNENETYAFSWIMKMSRNWMAHSNIFNNLTEQEIAFLFICNMRAMFDLGDNLLGYEKKLLSLFDYKEIKAMIGTGFRDRKIPLIQNYAALLHQSGRNREAINYHDALNQFQKYETEKSAEDVAFLITGLYQTFWFITSNGFISLPKKEGDLDTDKLDRYNALNYQFGFFDYGKSDFLLKFSSNIYNRSFLSGE